MAYPAYEEIELPLLKLIYENGGSKFQLDPISTYEPLAEHFNLTQKERLQTRDDLRGDGNNTPIWHNYVQWARATLVKNGYLDKSERGIWRLSKKGLEKATCLPNNIDGQLSSPDEISEDVIEGAKLKIVINKYERNPRARKECIAHYGYECSACGFDFHKYYGDRGLNFIHVHHIVPLSSIGKSYSVDPVSDLRPLCPNCHAMIHRTNPPCTIDDLKLIIKKTTN